MMKTSRRKFLKSGLLFVPAAAIGHVPAHVMQNYILAATSAPASSACQTEVMSDRAASASASNVGSLSGTTYVGQKLTATSDFTACAAGLYLVAVGSPTMNLFCSLWSHDEENDNPSAIIGTESSGYSASNVTTEAEHIFPNISAGISNGQVFWLVIRASATDASNYVQWRRRSVTGRICQDADGVGVWTLQSAARLSLYAIYKS